MTDEDLREKYRPESVKILFIGEWKPQNETFFYRENSNLYRYTKEAFVAAGLPFSLDLFKEYGCWLTDVCAEPVNGLDGRKRREKIKQGLPGCLHIISGVKPRNIIVVKKGDMRETVFHAIVRIDGFREGVNAFNVPFPSCGNQGKYRTELAEIVKGILADMR